MIGVARNDGGPSVTALQQTVAVVDAEPPLEFVVAEWQVLQLFTKSGRTFFSKYATDPASK